MDQEFPVHSEAVCARLDRIAAVQQEILRAGMAVIEAGAAKMFSMDFFAFGAVKRYLSTACAFGLMIETWNLVCARSLLRIHLDTALRFSAAWQVDNPHEFALAVLDGAQIDRIADRNKKLMKDAYLVALHTPDHPWLPEVYKRLSGYVHFSGSHMIDRFSTWVRRRTGRSTSTCPRPTPTSRSSAGSKWRTASSKPPTSSSGICWAMPRPRTTPC